MKLQSTLLLVGLLFGIARNMMAQDVSQYVKGLNSIVPGTPEASSIMKSIDFPVSLFTGQPNISIPITEVKGKSLNVPISLSYTATNGIRVTEMAGKTGLGWLLSAGGEITREVRGAPDEKPPGLVTDSGAFNSLKGDIMNNPDGDNAAKAARGQLDLEPDLYYFSIPGGSGKFIYDIVNQGYVCTQLEPYKVSLDNVTGIWSITGPDGTSYIFDKTVRTITRQSCNSALPVGTGDYVTTSWKLSKIRNADRTDSIMIDYESVTYTYFTEGSSTKYQLAPTFITASRPAMNCFNEDRIDGWEKILKISSVKDTVTFQYSNEERQDLRYQQKALEKIIFSNGEPSARTIFKFIYDYYERPKYMATSWAQADSSHLTSLRLKQITNYGNSESNPYPLNWKFSYDPNQLPSRLSYAQDFWGNFNSNSDASTLVPKGILTYDNNESVFVTGADRFIDTNRIQSGILKKIEFLHVAALILNMNLIRQQCQPKWQVRLH